LASRKAASVAGLRPPSCVQTPLDLARLSP
jgi:hypothetical protein